MSRYDPVPPEYVLEEKHAYLYIPENFAEGGDADPIEISLQALVDDSTLAVAELSMFQRAGRGGIANFFRFMRQTLDSGAGRHTQHVLAAACLYPDRAALIDLTAAGKNYLEARDSLAADVLVNTVLLGSMATEAMINSETNQQKVLNGKLHVPS